MIHFNSKANIVRVFKAKDKTTGRWTEAPVVIHADLPCRINWARGSERIMFDKTTYYRDGKVYCDIRDIKTNDRFVYNNVSYEIVNVSNPDNMNWYMILEIRLIQ